MPTRRRIQIWAFAVVVCGAVEPSGHTAKPARPGVCMRVAPALTGAVAVKIDRRVKMPRKTRDVRPAYPTLPRGTTGTGGWAGEILLGANGRVVAVWATREARLQPPFPAFNQAIEDAIHAWQFEPLMLDGRAVQACAAVAVSIDWS